MQCGEQDFFLSLHSSSIFPPFITVMHFHYSMRDFKLPTTGFRKLSCKEVKDFNPKDKDPDGDYGYLIEADLNFDGYRETTDKDGKKRKVHLHDYLQLPLLPERIRLAKDLLTDERKAFYEENPNIPNNIDKTVLMCNLFPKKKYVLFLPTLKQALEFGVNLEKIHQVWEFKQERFLAEYIGKNLKLRRMATSIGMSNVLKLVSNAMFGFFGVDPSKYMIVKLITDQESAISYMSKPNFKSYRVINDDLVLIEMSKTKVCLNNHLLVSAAILDWSKFYLYKILYTLVDHFGDRLTIVYLDTDGFTLQIESDNVKCQQDVWQELSEVKMDGEQVIDFSFLPKDNPLYSNQFEKVPGKLKDENGGKVIKTGYFVRKKVYGVEYYDGGFKMKNKGVKKCFLHKTLKPYRDAIFKQKVDYVKIRMMRSLKLQLQTIKSKKLAYSVYNDSRVLLGKIKTLPYGHRDLIGRNILISN